MSHTPGPWRPLLCIRNQRLKIGDWVMFPADPAAGAGPVPLHGVKPGDRTADANAKLIAAAPDLLAACRAVKADMTLLQFTDGRYIMDEFSAKSIIRLLGQAIAKAEGRA